LDGSFADVDFAFTINDKEFNHLWIMVDGIYPELSRFVKTISVPLSADHKKYAKWQEAARKSVERAFGILRRKFMILARPVEFFFVHEIRTIVEASISYCPTLIGWQTKEMLNRERLSLPLELFLQEHGLLKYKGSGQMYAHDAGDERANALAEAIRLHFDGMKKEFQHLYDRKKHFELRDAIVAVVASQK
jgi:hypothetical protein